MAGPVVAVVGRANVGKSTLVNRLIGRRVAIEHAEPGVTRDRQGYETRWAGRTFTIVDTGGWEPKARGLAAKVVAQARRAASEADLILFVVDAETGITGDDLAVARTLRGSDAPVLVVANKVDSAVQEAEVPALERLGFGAALPVSALHGRGSGDLLDTVVARLPEDVERDGDEEPQTRVALVGRPNVGKSSLLNRLAGEERAIVDDVPGTTRDAVDTVVTLGERSYRFIDTAGLRKRARHTSGPEYYGLVRTLRAIEEAEVALLVIDANEGPAEQDQKIASEIEEAGRAAVIVLNKWDLIPGEEAESVAEAVRDRLRFLSWAPLVRVSANSGRGIARLAPAIDAAKESWERRLPTASLNAWMRQALEQVPLGRTPSGRPVKVRYVTQARIRPPEVVVFANAELPDHARRAIENRLRDRFGFQGTPIRVTVRRRQTSK